MIPYSERPFKVEKDFLNRTRIYLYPSIVLLKSYKEGFLKVKDAFLCCSYQDGIVIYYDYRKNIKNLRFLIELLVENDELVEHSLFNQDVYKIRVKPDINYNAFEEGAYSRIYTDEQRKRVFSSGSITDQVLTKHSDAKQRHIENLNRSFNASYTIDQLELQDGVRKELSEYDLPPSLNEEIYEYEWRIPSNFSGGVRKAKTSIN